MFYNFAQTNFSTRPPQVNFFLFFSLSFSCSCPSGLLKFSSSNSPSSFYRSMLLNWSLMASNFLIFAERFSVRINKQFSCRLLSNKGRKKLLSSSLAGRLWFFFLLLQIGFHMKNLQVQKQEKLSSEAFRKLGDVTSAKNNKVHIHYQAHYAQHFRNDFFLCFL